MLGFDPRSFIIISTFLAALCGFVCFVLRRSVPKDIRGLTCWSLSCGMLVLASILFALRGAIGIVYSSYGANITLVAGIVLMYCSIRQLFNRRSVSWLVVAVPAAVALLLLWPTFMADNYPARIVIVSTTNALIFGAAAFVIRQARQKQFADYFTLVLFAVTGLVSAARCAAAVLSSATAQPLTDASSIQYLYLATFAFSVVGLSLGFILMVSKRLQIRLELAATRDGLTGIALRSAFEETAIAALAKSRITGCPPSLLMIDLDDFKRINDLHGHRGGDAVLKEFVRRTAAVLRSNDLFGRYGGEEFVVLLPETGHADALQIANRVCEAAGTLCTHGTPSFTASIGLTSTPAADGDLHTLFDQADRALYRAKAAGKNRVESYTGHGAPEYAR